MTQASALKHSYPTTASVTPDRFDGNKGPNHTGEPSNSDSNQQSYNPLRQFQKVTKGLRTLIVEDDPVDQKIAIGAATQLGLHWELVDSGDLAIDKLKACDGDKPFDLVLLDYKLPNLDGLTACKHIKTEVKLNHLPRILLLSAYHKDEIFHVHSDRSLVDGFITKPVSPHFLGSTVLDLHEAAKHDDENWPSIRRNDDDLLARCHVLLAEDNVINQRVAIGMLSRKGIKVTLAQNGQEAIEKVLSKDASAYDIVLMDMDMPLVDGYDATRRIRSTLGYEKLPVIALTAHNSANDRKRCLEAGMSEYLTKPIKPNFLYETLLTFLR